MMWVGECGYLHGIRDGIWVVWEILDVEGI
jgi:hypothetical protein